MGVAPKTEIDPFTVEIVKDSLVAIGDEMFVALQRTSKSTIIYEVLDFASGLVDAKGQLITQGNGVTGFLGTLTFAVRSTLEKFGPESLPPGDVVITDDPYSGGGTHLSDVTLVVPIHYGGELVAFSACKAHWTEVGGKDPGSWTTDATEVFQEGLQFPCVKLYEEGRPNQALIDLIEANVRLPDMTLGDMYAQAASLRLGAQRFSELCDKYGLEVVMSSIDALLDHGERRHVPAAQGDLPAAHDLFGRAAGRSLDLLGDDAVRRRPCLEGARAGRARAPERRALPLRLRDGRRRPPPGLGRAVSARRAAGRWLGRRPGQGRRVGPRLLRRRRDVRDPGRDRRDPLRGPRRPVRLPRDGRWRRPPPRRPRAHPRLPRGRGGGHSHRDVRPTQVPALGGGGRPRRLAQRGPVPTRGRTRGRRREIRPLPSQKRRDRAADHGHWRRLGSPTRAPGGSGARGRPRQHRDDRAGRARLRFRDQSGDARG